VAITVRAPLDTDVLAMFAADARGFGFHYSDEDIELQRPIIDVERFRIALDGKAIVGVSGSFALELTVPGGATVPMGGVTWVSVALTHRRQGVMSALLAAVHADIAARQEPVAGLGAAEGAIYERFGYGVATHQREVVIRKHTARFRPAYVPASGSVWFLDADDAKGHVVDVWERTRRVRPGESTRSAAWWELLFGYQAKERDGYSPAFRLAHADGYATYRVKSGWDDGHPNAEMEVTELVAATPEAHAALWHALLNMDLIGTITTRRLALDDPLPYLLENHRAVRTKMLSDALWLRPGDAGALLSARTYTTDDRLVLEVREASSGSPPVRWEVEGGLDGATARRTRRRPDLVVPQAALGSLYLGGVRPSLLARGHRLNERTPGALRRADAFFATDVLPFAQNQF
jgi:predicted acetyltransferase